VIIEDKQKAKERFMFQNARLSWTSRLVAVVFAASMGWAIAATSPTAKEQEFVGVLQSATAGKPEKAIACKQLAIYGSPAAVPALAPLLRDAELASWARIALEAIPGSAADRALRDALGQTKGLLQVGVINSIGVRRDAGAVEGLSALLVGSDGQVASAAAIALGHIGGDLASQSLEGVLARVSGEVKDSVAEGCILVAEGFLAAGRAGDAVRLYDRVRGLDVFKPRILEATRGAILARGDAGLPLLREQLVADDKEFLSVGLRTARELKGEVVTRALVEAVKTGEVDRQGLILMALGDRQDELVIPAVAEFARSGSPALKVVAVGILERKGDLGSLPVLLEAAVDSDKSVAEAARTSLARFGGFEVDARLMERMRGAEGTMLEVLVELAGVRGIEKAVPLVAPYAASENAGVRSAALGTVGTLGGVAQLPALVELMPGATKPRDRAEVEKAIVSIAGREGATATGALLPLLKSGSRQARMAALHALGAAGGEQALAAVVKAVGDSEEAVQDEAVRTLASWPNTWPGDGAVAQPLLDLAKNGRKPAHKVQGLRGYLAAVKEDRNLNDAAKLERVKGVMSMVVRAEERRQVISVLSGVATVDSLEMLIELSQDSETAEEACLAIVNIVGGPRLGSADADVKQRALQVVLERSKNDRTLSKARELR
jgi:HEAT repeat protein